MKKTLLLLFAVFILYSCEAQIWKPFGIGVSPNEVNDFTIYNNELYACGGFRLSGNDTLNGIARWDGTNWNSLGTGLHSGGAGYCMAAYNNQLIIGGVFPDIIGIPAAKNIASWDGTSWHSLASGIQWGTVSAMAVYQGNLYAGGNIVTVDSMPMRDIAKWDGTTWSLPCTINAGLSEIFAMAVFNNELYIGGYFGTVNSIPAYNIAKFDGTAWSGVGGGFNSGVFALYSDTINNRLYAAGNFNYAAAGSVACPSNVAYWDGFIWNPIGNGPSLYPHSLGMYKNELYVEVFDDTVITAINDTLNLIARWDSANWKPLGKGMNCNVHAFEVFNNELAVGGCFTKAGDTSANEVASWNYTPVSVSEIKNDVQEEIKIIPNPFKNSAIVELPGTFKKYFPCTFKLIDIAGKETIEVKNISALSFTISKAALSEGVYFYKLLSKKEEVAGGKLVIE